MLNELARRGFYVDQFKAARSVMFDMGHTLEEILNDELLAIEFQTLIMCEKYNNDKKLHLLSGNYLDNCDIVFVERSMIDLYAFAVTWQDRFSPRFTDWVNRSYSQKCLEKQKIYLHNFFLPAGVFNHVDDGVRAKADTQSTVSMLVCATLENYNHHIVEASSVKDRADEIIAAVSDMW